MTILIPTDCTRCKFRQEFSRDNIQTCKLFNVTLSLDKVSGIPLRCMQCTNMFPGGGRFDQVREDTFTPAEIGNMCNPVLCEKEVNDKLVAKKFQKNQSAIDGNELILLHDGEFYGRCGVINTEAGRVLRVIRWIRETVDVCNESSRAVQTAPTVTAVLLPDESEELFPVTMEQRIDRELDIMQKEILEDIKSSAPVQKMPLVKHQQ